MNFALSHFSLLYVLLNLIFVVFGTSYLQDLNEDGCQWIPKYGHFVKQGHRDESECYQSLGKAKNACEEAGDCFAIASQPDVCEGKFRVSHGYPTFLHFEGGLAWFHSCPSHTTREAKPPVFSQVCTDCGCGDQRTGVDFEFLGNASSVDKCIQMLANTDALCGSKIIYGSELCFCRIENAPVCNQIKAIGWNIYSMESCDLILVKDYTEDGNCEYAKSYGCFGLHMFVSHNCSALFEYNSFRFQCFHDGGQEVGHCTLPVTGSCPDPEVNITAPNSICHHIPNMGLTTCPGFYWGDSCFPIVEYSYEVLESHISFIDECEELSINIVYSFVFNQPWELLRDTFVRVVIVGWSSIEERVSLRSLSSDFLALNFTIKNLTNIIQPLQLIIYMQVKHFEHVVEFPFMDKTLLYNRLQVASCQSLIAWNPWELDIGAKITNSEGYNEDGGFALGSPIRAHLWIKSSVYAISEMMITRIEITVGYRHSFLIYGGDDFNPVHVEMGNVMGCCNFVEDVAPSPEGRGEETITWLLFLEPKDFTPLIADDQTFTMKITFCTVRSLFSEWVNESSDQCYETSTAVTLLPFTCEWILDDSVTYVAQVGTFARIPCEDPDGSNVMTDSDGYALMYCDVTGWNSEMSRIFCDIIEVVLPPTTENECTDMDPCELEPEELHYTTTYTLLLLICILAIFVFCSLLGIFHAKIMESPQNNDNAIAVRRRIFPPLWLLQTFKYKRPNADENVESSESKSDDDTPVCYICLMKIHDDDFFIQLPCKHRFHTHCLSPWLHGHTTCPTCRFDLRQLFYE